MLQSGVCTFAVIGVLITGGCGDPVQTNTGAGSAEGMWTGTVATNRTLTAAVLDDGTYYLFYSAPGNSTILSGVLQGAGTSASGTFSSSNTKDFAVQAATLDATLSSPFTARQFLNGTVAYTGGGMTTFTSSYNTAYDTTPTIGSFVGVYQGQASSFGGSQTATITVSSDGSFTGTEQNGCTFAGSLALRTRGNVVDQTLTFGGGTCFFGSTTFTGIAFRDVATNRLYAAAPNSDRTDAAMFLGNKIF
jgi:hypothetical protein